MESLPLDNVVVTRRLREDHGDIESLMTSISEHGLLHPIVVDAEDRLVAGGRRLAAVRNLGQREIAVRRLGDLTDQQRREIELDENIRRKDLTAYERSKFVSELADTAKGNALQESRTDSVRLSARGFAPRPTADRQVADQVGIPAQTIRDARQHVAAVEAHPEMESWPQRQVLDHVRAERRPPAPIAASSPPLLLPTTSAAEMARAIRSRMGAGFVAELMVALNDTLFGEPSPAGERMTDDF